MVDAEDPSSTCGGAQRLNDGAVSSGPQEQRTRQDNTRIATSPDMEQLEGTWTVIDRGSTSFQHLCPAPDAVAHPAPKKRH